MANPKKIILRRKGEWAEVQDQKFREGSKKYIALITGFDDKYELKRKFIPRSEDKNSYRVEYFSKGDFYEVVSTYYTSRGQPRNLIRGYYQCTKISEEEIVLEHVGKKAVKQALQKSPEGALHQLKKKIESLAEELNKLEKSSPTLPSEITNLLKETEQALETSTMIKAKIIPELKALYTISKPLDNQIKNALRELKPVIEEYKKTSKTSETPLVILKRYNGKDVLLIKEDQAGIHLLLKKYTGNTEHLVTWHNNGEITYNPHLLADFLLFKETSYFNVPALKQAANELSEHLPTLKKAILEITLITNEIQKIFKETLHDINASKYFGINLHFQEDDDGAIRVAFSNTSWGWSLLHNLSADDVIALADTLNKELNFLRESNQKFRENWDALVNVTRELGSQVQELQDHVEKFLKTWLKYLGQAGQYNGGNIAIDNRFGKLEVTLNRVFVQGKYHSTYEIKDIKKATPLQLQLVIETLINEKKELETIIENLNKQINAPELHEMLSKIQEFSSAISKANTTLEKIMDVALWIGYPYDERLGRIYYYSTPIWDTETKSLTPEGVEKIESILTDLSDRISRKIKELNELTTPPTEEIEVLKDLKKQKEKEILSLLEKVRDIFGNPAKIGPYTIYYAQKGKVESIYFRKWGYGDILLYDTTHPLPIKHLQKLNNTIKEELESIKKTLEGVA